jgi:glycopeptide antibiotics resistance protein
MDESVAPLQQRRVIWLLALVLLLIVYGSLFPFSFARQGTAPLAWVWASGVAGIRDTVLNLAIYVPVGFLTFYAARSRSRIWTAVLLSLVVSGALEYLQSFDQGRVSSSVDLLLNGIGGFIGAWVASLLPRRVTSDPVPFAVVLLAVVARTYPFVPALHVHWLPFRWDQVLFAGIDWLAVRCALAAFLQRNAVTKELAVLMLTAPTMLFILDHGASPSDCVGALLALAIGHVWMSRPKQLAPYMLLSVITRELLPLQFASTPQDFNWIPFAAFLGSQASAVVFLNKLLLYGSTLWLLDPMVRRIWKCAWPFAGLLFVLERVQRYLPGRTPDITDSCLVLVAACVLSALRPNQDATGTQACPPRMELETTL